MITTRFPTRKARFVDTPSNNAAWRVLHRLADAAYPELRDALETVLTQAGLNIPLEVLTQYLASGPPTLAITALEEAWRTGGAPALQDVFETHIPPLVTSAAQAAQGTAGVTVAFAVTDPAILLAVEAYGAERVVAIAETTREAIRAATSTAFQTHQNVGQLARTIRELVGLTPRQAESVVRYHAGLLAEGMSASRVETLVARQTQRLIRRRAETIARHETLSAANRGQQLLWQQAQEQGLVSAGLKRYWTVTPDDRLCFICAAIPGLNPDGVGIDASFQTPVGAVLFPPAHVSCFPGDTRVLASQILNATQRWYDGEMLTFHTRAGYQFSCTPNHPILTRHGWVLARELQIGTEICRGIVSEGVSAVYANHQCMPATFQDVWQAFSDIPGSRGCRVKVTHHDFHGDGEGSKVAIIRANGFLRHSGDPQGNERFEGCPLIPVHARGLHFTAREPQEDIMIPDLSSRSFVSCRHLVLALEARHVFPFDPLGFPLGSEGDAFLLEPSGDAPTTNTVDISKLLTGYSAKIVWGERRWRMRDSLRAWASSQESPSQPRAFLPPSKRDSFLQEYPLDRVQAQRVLLPQHEYRGSIEICADDIVFRDIRTFCGHVYNLQTDTGWYMANTIIAHNCRCATILTDIPPEA